MSDELLDPAPPADTTVVHLLRRGEVENPKGVIYGGTPAGAAWPRGAERGRPAAGAVEPLRRPGLRGGGRLAPAPRALVVPAQPALAVLGRALPADRDPDAGRHGRRPGRRPRPRGGVGEPPAAD